MLLAFGWIHSTHMLESKYRFFYQQAENWYRRRSTKWLFIAYFSSFSTVSALGRLLIPQTLWWPWLQYPKKHCELTLLQDRSSATAWSVQYWRHHLRQENSAPLALLAGCRNSQKARTRPSDIGKFPAFFHQILCPPTRMAFPCAYKRVGICARA